RWEQLVLGGAILVFSPVLLIRFGHAALCGQFLVLLSLALHFRLARAAFIRHGMLLYIPLLTITLLVHVYLFAMVFAVFFASLLQALWTERISIRSASGHLAANAAVLGAVMAACGYFSTGPMLMKPYGEWALDLAAPFTPGPSGLFGIDE